MGFLALHGPFVTLVSGFGFIHEVVLMRSAKLAERV
jgi:hypothetical protein